MWPPGIWGLWDERFTKHGGLPRSSLDRPRVPLGATASLHPALSAASRHAPGSELCRPPTRKQPLPSTHRLSDPSSALLGHRGQDGLGGGHLLRHGDVAADVLQYAQLPLVQQPLEVILADKLRREPAQQPVQRTVLLLGGEQESDGLSDLGVDLGKSRRSAGTSLALCPSPQTQECCLLLNARRVSVTGLPAQSGRTPGALQVGRQGHSRHTRNVCPPAKEGALSGCPRPHTYEGPQARCRDGGPRLPGISTLRMCL